MALFQKRKKIKSAVVASRSLDKRRLGLYIHIPFCRRKCVYCDFYSLPVGELPGKGENDETRRMDRYAAALTKHLTEAGGQAQSPVDTVYFGGGTPTVLGAARLCGLLKTVKQSFALIDGAEITCEANPESADFKTLKKLRRAGFNRLSLGVQSLDDRELGLLGRIHTAAEAKAAYDAARAAGFENVSVDLMYGIEGQTPESWEQTLAGVIAWGPEHISAYGLRVEEGTPLAQRTDAVLPGDDDQADLYLAACAMLQEAGYEHYEISNWSKPRRESKHNLRYWRLEPYLGFGPAAHSDCYGARYSNVRDLESYITGIELGGAVLDEYEEIPERERGLEYVMLSLRTTDGVDLDNLSRRFAVGGDPASTDRARAVFRRLTAEGFAVYEGGGRWRLSDRGWLLSNSIILEVAEAMTGHA